MGGNEKHRQPVRSTVEGSSPFEAWLTTYRSLLEWPGETESSYPGSTRGRTSQFRGKFTADGGEETNQWANDTEQVEGSAR